MSEYRTHFCSELTINDLKKEVVLSGWVDTIRNDDGDDGHIDECDPRQFRHVLSYLAGVPHLARGRVLDTIKGFYEPE